MAVNNMISNILSFSKKYRYVILILLIGIAFMLIPTVNTHKPVTVGVMQESKTQESISEELEEILSCVDGAGKAKVLISYSHGEEIFYQTDQEHSASDTQESEKYKTVIITSNDKTQSGLISRVDPAKYLGVIVLCQGAEQPSVRLAVMDAVSKVTGLGTDRISVLKMK